MRKQQYVTISILSILLASIFLIDNSQYIKALVQNNNSNSNDAIDTRVAIPTRIASQNSQTSSGFQSLSPQMSTQTSPSMNNTIGGRAATMNPTPEITPSNLTTTLDSIMNPKALLASAIDQIRNSTSKIISNNNQTAATVFVRNQGTILLSHQIIPPKDFILIYDAIRYKIVNGQIFAKLPCDSNSKSPLQILIGRLSELKPAQLQLITGLSKPGYTCMYYVHLTSENNTTAAITNATSKEAKMHSIMKPEVGLGEDNLTITNIELLNPTDYSLILPNTASLAISVNQIKPLEELHVHHIKQANATVRS
ncbi:MAG: hypothetical protein WCC17_10840 [Candidatus Nitrosopolaris sp.]